MSCCRSNNGTSSSGCTVAYLQLNALARGALHCNATELPPTTATFEGSTVKQKLPQPETKTRKIHCREKFICTEHAQTPSDRG